MSAERKIFIKNDIISLAERLPEDNKEIYECWFDEEVQSGYNFKLNKTFEEWLSQNIEREEFHYTSGFAIILNETNKLIGSIGVSMFPNEEDDLTINIFKPYRNQGLGTMAFALGAKYCFDVLKFEKIYAGCYPDNIRSRKMIEKCGFVPHPEGNIEETHYITGEPVTQFDFVLTKENFIN